jgi:2-dehydro-3-deoxyglucarate aldolase/4-hydroxy-2-oxoheptanedioate aldolase
MGDARLRGMAGNRELKLGHFVVEFATPGIGHILANAGCDFVLFDMEHSGFGYETVRSAIRYFEAAGVAVIIRVPTSRYDHVARAMDMGAEGLMVPLTADAAEAERVVDAVKYVPDGKRGVALGVSHDNYRPKPVLEALRAANERSTVFVQIETAEAVENAEEIAAVEGVDCLWVGHFDLSCSLGIPGEFDHPKFRDAIDRTLAACRKHGKSTGRLAQDTKTGVALFDEGFDFICYSGDVWLLQAALKAGIDDLRAGCADRTAGGGGA